MIGLRWEMMVLKGDVVNARRWDLRVGGGLGSPWERLASALATAL